MHGMHEVPEIQHWHAACVGSTVRPAAPWGGRSTTTRETTPMT